MLRTEIDFFLLKESGEKLKQQLILEAEGISNDLLLGLINNNSILDEKIQPHGLCDLDGRFFCFYFGVIDNGDKTKFWLNHVVELDQDEFLDSYAAISKNR